MKQAFYLVQTIVVVNAFLALSLYCCTDTKLEMYSVRDDGDSSKVYTFIRQLSMCSIFMNDIYIKIDIFNVISTFMQKILDDICTYVRVLISIIYMLEYFFFWLTERTVDPAHSPDNLFLNA